jgi:polar amino acid transport system substrate-binding protein
MTPTPDLLNEIAPTGTLRAAINHGNPVLAKRGPDGGRPQGVSVDLAAEVARRLGLPLAFVEFDGAAQVADCAGAGVWDIAFLAVDPKRAEQVAFTPPYVVIEGSYLVRDDALQQRIDDFDRPGLRIAAAKGAAYELVLARTLKQATLVHTATSPEALQRFLDDGLEAAAGVRQPLLRFAAGHPGLRVIPGRFAAIEQAMGVPRGRPAALAWLIAFIEEAKAGGAVAEALARHGQTDAAVAPPAAG